jgi:hypothetical protein
LFKYRTISLFLQGETAKKAFFVEKLPFQKGLEFNF